MRAKVEDQGLLRQPFISRLTGQVGNNIDGESLNKIYATILKKINFGGTPLQ